MCRRTGVWALCCVKRPYLWLRRFLRLLFGLRTSVRFYKDVLGLEIVYGGERSYFTSLRTKDGDTILNLEHGNASIQWGRLIFHVSDVDRFWAYLMEKGFHPDTPHDASWGERYFHMPDPDGHELSFARPF